MATMVSVPYLGLTTVEVTVVKWLKQVGETVAKNEALVEVLTEKVNNVVEAPEAGTVLMILAPEETVVPVEGALCWIGVSGEEVPDEVAGMAPIVETLTESPTTLAPSGGRVDPVPEDGEYVRASPAAKRLARERGINLARVPASRPDGRVSEKDVARYVEQVTQKEPHTDPVKATPLARKLAAESGVDLTSVEGSGLGGRVRAEDVSAGVAISRGALGSDLASATRAEAALAPAEITTTVPMIGLRRVVAQRMFQSARTVPRVTHTTEADVTETVRMRQSLVARAESRGEIRPSYTDVVVKIVAQALREHPRMNARLAEEQVELLEAVNVGVAVSVPEGLTVPVIHGADSKSIGTIAGESRDKIERARAGALTNEDLTGGTFTVTNLGTYEIDAFSPIINLPEAGILGVGRIIEKPAAVNGQITIRSMMYLSLTFDHRIIDGAPAAAFLRTLKHYLEQPYELLAVC